MNWLTNLFGRNEGSATTGDEIHIHNHIDSEISRRLDRIEALLRALYVKGEKHMTNIAQVMQDLQDEVASNTSVTTSATALIERLADEVENAQNDPGELQAIVDQLRTNGQSLSDAVSANTPAEGGGDAGGPVGGGGGEGAPGENPIAEGETPGGGSTPGEGESPFGGGTSA
jgi:hypothetical protein